MTEIIFAHGGTLDKYIGDGLMALFGAPAATPDDPTNAVACAAAMQRQMASINAALSAEGLPEIKVGIGLHTGVATVGYIGSGRREGGHRDRGQGELVAAPPREHAGAPG